MDNFDKKILAELQLDGRLSITELADKVNLSLSPCHRRVKALEESGVIKNYRAELNSQKVGLNFCALVFVTMKEGTQTSIANFEIEIAAIPEIIEAERLFGDPDYILRIVSKDLESFQKLYDQKLSMLPGIQHLTSTIVMKSVVKNRILPL